MSYTYQTQYISNGGTLPFAWPNVVLTIGDSTSHIILPVSGVAVVTSASAFTVTTIWPGVALTGSGQTITLSTQNTPGFPYGQNFLYQFNSTAGPNGNGLPYTNQLYAIWNDSSVAATIVSDVGTVNSGASYSQSANSVVVYQYDQSSNWTPNVATAGSNFHYW